MSEFSPLYSVLETPQTDLNLPDVYFKKGLFDDLINTKGYNVYHDKLIKCPCVSSESHSPLSTCTNCGGAGYTLIKRSKTKMILHSMNLQTRYKEWSEEKLGTVSVTALSEDRLDYMDRVIVLDSFITTNDLLTPFFDIATNSFWTYTTYWIQSIVGIWFFKQDTEELIQLAPEIDFTFNKNIITFNPQFNTDFTSPSFSVVYLAYPQYHIVDTPRDIMSANTDENGKIIENKVFPVHGIGRRSHQVIDRQNYDDTFLKNNSTKAVIGYYGEVPNTLIEYQNEPIRTLDELSLLSDEFDPLLDDDGNYLIEE